jgi:hypothetical protein
MDMRNRNGLYGALVVGIFAGTIAIAGAAGAWQTTGRTASGTGSSDGTGAGSSATLVGTSTTEIKGWMAIGDVAAAWNIPLPDLLAAFDLPADTAPAAALKDLESDVFSVTNLRDWLDARPQAQGGAAAPSGSTAP